MEVLVSQRSRLNSPMMYKEPLVRKEHSQRSEKARRAVLIWNGLPPVIAMLVVASVAVWSRDQEMVIGLPATNCKPRLKSFLLKCCHQQRS